LSFAPQVGSKSAHAANVYFHKGEGGAGTDADVELGQDNEFTLAMNCRNEGGSRKLQLGAVRQ
jgi:hypothetical protein